ncbi:hypothetical protein ACU5JM_08235 [Rhodococcus erythropolis]|uniref:hypothetical protein n=1 Tax=Rhodococcus erythropolis TaxID=1833 RepID=UPI00406BD61F
MAKQITDNASKSPVAQEDILLVRDVTSNTDKKTTVAGVAPAVAANLPPASVSSAKINFGGSGAGVWWEEIARTTIASSGTSIIVSGIPYRKYMQVIVTAWPGGAALDMYIRFNGDTSANYVWRYDGNNGTVTNTVSGSSFVATGSGGPYPKSTWLNVVNVANREKMIFGECVESGGLTAVNISTKSEVSGKWANSTEAINSISVFEGTGTSNAFASGSEVIILGHN